MENKEKTLELIKEILESEVIDSEQKTEIVKIILNGEHGNFYPIYIPPAVPMPPDTYPGLQPWGRRLWYDDQTAPSINDVQATSKTNQN